MVNNFQLIVSIHSEQTVNLNRMRECVRIIILKKKSKYHGHITKYWSLIRNKNIWRFHFLSMVTQKRFQKKIHSCDSCDNGYIFLKKLLQSKINKHMTYVIHIPKLFFWQKHKHDFCRGKVLWKSKIAPNRNNWEKIIQ